MTPAFEAFGIVAGGGNRRPIGEKEFMGQVKQLASMLGWTWYHTFNSRRSTAGFPDLVLVRNRVVFAELKKQDEKPTPEQAKWINRLRRVRAEVYVWKPSDMAAIGRILADQNVPVDLLMPPLTPDEIGPAPKKRKERIRFR